MKRLPLITVVIVTSCLLTNFFPILQDAFIYDRLRVSCGELWRLWTGNLVHISRSHLAYDLVVFGIAGLLIERPAYRVFGWLCALTAGSIGAALFVLQPEVRVYCGSSGLATAAIVFVALHGAAGLRDRPMPAWRWICIITLLSVCAKIIFELKTARYLFLANDSRISVCPLSHLTGAAVATVAFCIEAGRRPMMLLADRARVSAIRAISVMNSARSRRIVVCIGCVLAAQFLSGCITHALWNDELVESFHEPSAPSNLALFKSSSADDLIVQYDELSPWRDTVTRRTYLLQENWRRIQSRRKPRFEPTANITNATPIPVFASVDAAARSGTTNTIFAVAPANGTFFTVFRTNAPPAGPYHLPSYRGWTGNGKLAGMTPLTVTADASVFGGFLAYMYLLALAHSGGGPIWPCR